MENKIVDIYLGMHGWTNRFVHELVADDYKTFIIESTTHFDVTSLIKEYNLIKKSRAPYSKHKFAIIERLLKNGVDIVIGDFGESAIANNKIHNSIEIFDYIPNISDIKDIKLFYQKWGDIESLRNNNYIYNINNAEGPIWIRIGGAHGLIVKELKKQWSYDISVVTDTWLMNYHAAVVRKYCLGLNISDDEYRKWVISHILSLNQTVSKNLHGKEFAELNQKHYNLIYAPLNALIDSYEKPLDTLKISSIMDLFTSQSLKDPSFQRIPRQDIRDFLKEFSVKKYGTTVYYERLEKQGFIF